MSEFWFQWFIAGLAGSRDVLAPFSGFWRPDFLNNIIPNSGRKVQEKDFHGNHEKTRKFFRQHFFYEAQEEQEEFFNAKDANDARNASGLQMTRKGRMNRTGNTDGHSTARVEEKNKIWDLF